MKSLAILLGLFWLVVILFVEDTNFLKLVIMYGVAGWQVGSWIGILWDAAP